MYNWNKDKTSLKEGWYCVDGYATETNSANYPTVDLNSAKEDSFLADLFAQDCMVDNQLSSVTVDDSGQATFVVHFMRYLSTRGLLHDAQFKVGEKIKTSYFYRENTAKPVSDKSKDNTFTITILDSSVRNMYSMATFALSTALLYVS